MNVLSLFDGMSCGQIALERAGIIVDNYYASEIDKYSIRVTMANYPDTIQLGSVVSVSASSLPNIDLLIGGSPCQGFSFAGKQLNFEDERSKLFFEYLRLLKEIKPKYFLLENVKMKQEHELVINKCLNIRPIKLNSSLVSAQNRNRLYWTNIPVNTIPKDKKIFLKDIIDNGFVDRHKSYCLQSTYSHNGTNLKRYQEKGMHQVVYGAAQRGREKGQVIELNGTQKSNSLTTVNKDTLIMYNNDNIRKLTPIECERLQTVPDNYTNHVSDTQRYKMLGNGWTVDIIAHILKHIK